MANTYDRGDTIRLAGTYVASFNQVIEPATVCLLIRNPLGSVGSYSYNGVSSSVHGPVTVVRVASGAYYADLMASANPANGVWTYRFDSGGGVTAAAGEQSFNIRLTPFT